MTYFSRQLQNEYNWYKRRVQSHITFCNINFVTEFIFYFSFPEIINLSSYTVEDSFTKADNVLDKIKN